MPASYRLTPDLVAAHGGECVALAAAAFSRPWRAYARRPGAAYNRALTADGCAALLPTLGASLAYDTPGLSVSVDAPEAPSVQLVFVTGPLLTHAGAPGPCADTVDGHDAVAERLISAMRAGPVTLAIFESPGGSAAGIASQVDRVLAVKAETGAYVIGWCPLAGSAAAWWALAVCDEIHTPRDGVIGSIGVRGQHNSIAGELAQKGIVPTFSYAPDEGKLAGVEELPISPEGKSRMDAMTAGIFVMFAAAVANGPVARAAGLTPAGIAAQSARAYTGDAAVKAGVATGVAPLADVMSYALLKAGAGGQAMPGDAKPDEPGKDDAAPESDDMKGQKPDGICKACQSANPLSNHFCGGCGASMAATPPADDGPKSEPAPKPGATAPPRAGAESAMAASIAGMIPGLHAGASVVAVKSALSPIVALATYAMTLTGTANAGEARGGLEALAKDAAKAARYRSERDAANVKAEGQERIGILLALAKRGEPEHARAKLIVDVVAADGKTLTGEVRPAKLWGDGTEGRSMANLRGYYKTVCAGAPAPAAQSPFQPDATRARAAGNQGAAPAAVVSQTGLSAETFAAAQSFVDNMIAGHTAQEGL